MVSINLVYQTVLTLANSDIRGNITPNDIRLLINLTVNEIQEEYFLDVNRFVNRENRGLINRGLENVADKVREKILHFLKNATLTYNTTTTDFSLPEDLRYFDSIYYNEVEIEAKKDAKEFKLVSNMPNLVRDYPIYLKLNNKIKVAPSTVTNNVNVYYLRNPLVANWTYMLINESEVFNPSAADFQDIDLHSSEFYNVVIRTCLKAGINLKEQDLQMVMKAQETNQFNQEITS